MRGRGEREVRVVEDVAGAFSALVAQVRPRTIGLSGGGTARRCYARLAEEDTVDWSGVEVLVSDERWVPVDHDDSNEGMARRVLLDGVPVAAVHSLREAGETIDEAADAYDRLVAGYERIDLLHLGLGDDAHTASLFPGSPALAVDDRYVVATGDERHEHPRLTFTFPGIAKARLVVVTVSGEGKREAFARARAGDPAAPASRIEAESVLWLVDPAAAGQSTQDARGRSNGDEGAA